MREGDVAAADGDLKALRRGAWAALRALRSGFELKMSDPFTTVAVILAASVFVGVAGCDGQHPGEDQGAAAHSSTPAAKESDLVEASLRPSRTHGWLEIAIKNIGTRPFTFLDAREGSACCEEFWEVEMRLASGRTLKPTMFYSPIDLPWKVSIEPGKTYVREIQPGAYVEFYHPKTDEEGAIIVHYRVKHTDDWTSLLAPPYPAFSTRPLQGKLADYLLH